MTRVATLLLRAGLYIDLLTLFGLSCFALLGGRGAGEGQVALDPQRIAPVLSLAGFLLWGLLLVHMAAEMAGRPALAVDRATLATMVSQTAAGAAWLVRTACLVGATAAAFGPPRSRHALFALLAGGAAATLAWNGHGAMDDGARGWLHLLTDIAHLLATGLWLRTILTLLAALTWLRVPIPVAARALERFGRLGTIVVLVVVTKDIVNGLFVVGLPAPDRMLASEYGRLLLAKLLLFLLMLGAAAANRWRLTPRPGIDATRAAACARCA